MHSSSVHGRSLAIAAASIATLWLAGLVGLAAALGFVHGGMGFSIAHWEVTRLVSFATNRSASVVTNRAATDAEVRRYFDLLTRARAAHQRQLSPAAGGVVAGARSEEAHLLAEAGGLRVLVEARYEQAIRTAAQQAGLTESLPLFGGLRLVWPPVAAGFSVPPHILIISPRDHIALQDTQLLRTDLTDPQAAMIEQQAEKKGVSALVDQIGGLGAYPTISDENDSPLGLMQTVAHEWTHDYLAFHPLGARYAASNDLTLINETVANLVGRELGSMAFESLHLPPPLPATPNAAPGALDFNKTMHDLRLEVDTLLKAGQIAEAERQMNATQQVLAANGYHIRRINQAYFAFYGSYGDNPAASNPLGDRVQALRRLSGSLAEFVHRVEGVSQPADLNRLVRDAAFAEAAPRP